MPRHNFCTCTMATMLAALLCFAFAERANALESHDQTTRSTASLAETSAIVVAQLRAERRIELDGAARERGEGIIDSNGTNNQSTSCNCSPVNCSYSGFSSAACQITCTTGLATCSCGGCGGPDAGADSGNDCRCQ